MGLLFDMFMFLVVGFIFLMIVLILGEILEKYYIKKSKEKVKNKK